MNALQGSADTLKTAGKQLVRRIPLTIRTLELVAVAALYIAGLVFIDELTGRGQFPVMVYAMFLLPAVISVGVRWYRTLERRTGLEQGHLPFTG